MADESFTGTVDWFNETKGYGFITPDDGSPNVYVDFNEIQGGVLEVLIEGQKVQFEKVMGPKGSTAVNVTAA